MKKSVPGVSKKSESSPLVGDNTPPTRLFLLLPQWRQILVAFLLVTALVLNIVALVPNTPFLKLEVQPPLDQFIAPGNYGLGATLGILSAHHIWFLYVIVVLFSIIFPPVKLIVIALVLGLELTTSRRQKVLGILGHLGRWSLIDIYFAMTLMMIVYHQGVDVTLGPFTLLSANIATEAGYGLYVFHASIISSMAVVTMLQDLNPIIQMPERPRPPVLTRRPLLFYGGFRAVGGLIASIITLVLGLCGVLLPVFQIVGVEQDGLTIPLNQITHETAPSITEVAPLFAVDMTITIIIIPSVTMLFCIAIQLLPLPTVDRWCYTTIRYLSEWSMYDVYIAAFVIYLCQESNLISLKLRPATYCMFFYLPFMVAAVVLSETSVKAAVEARLKQLERELPPPGLATSKA